jgi:K+-transporting ATPase KdpF subunit
MIGLTVLYGFGGLCALLLLAYLVYALFCAEEF